MKNPAKTGAGLPWKIRAVQMDLARQMETVDYMEHYADFAAEQGFNTLVLYLEGRVRTASFPYREKKHSYSLEDMRRIVAHAGGLGMEVVPVIASLGHAAQFVSCPELAHLAEERCGRTRFGGGGTFCASLDETYDFLERYLKELSEVFTGQNFHLGCDEAWNFGYCDLCSARGEKQGLGAMFVEHCRRMEKICGRLGKRMWIWDDMFEFFPGHLEKMPRSILLCHWNYNEIVDEEGARAHFANKWRRDWLAEYGRLGFDALICPWTHAPRNIVTFTDYARRHNVLGGLMTQWELSRRFHDEYMPLVAFAGRLWSAPSFDPELAWKKSLDSVFPGASSRLQDAVRAVSEIPRHFPSSPQITAQQGLLTEAEYANLLLSKNALALLSAAGKPEPGLAGRIVGDLEQTLRLHLLQMRLRDFLPALISPRRLAGDLPLLRKRLKQAVKELGDLIRLRAPLHKQIRPGMHPDDHGLKHLKSLLADLKKYSARLSETPSASSWLAVVRLFLPDSHGAPRLKVELLANGIWKTLGEAVYKPPHFSLDPYYTVCFPFESKRRPSAVRFEVSGYGGQGIAFVELQSPTETLYPAKVAKSSGSVSDPRMILRDDSRWAFLGNSDITPQIHRPELAGKKAVMEICLT